MINFIIVSHGNMAKGTLSAVEMIVGKQDGIMKINLEEGDSIEMLRKKIEKAILSLNSETDGILIMVDLFGASPFNMACIAASEYDNVEVISGFNLPMLLESIIHRGDLLLPDMVSLAMKSGREGIKLFEKQE